MKKYTFSAVLAAFAMTACVSETLQEETLPEETLGRMKFSAVTESHQTRTYLGDKNEGVYDNLWSAGDAIEVFGDGAGPYRFDLYRGEDSSQAEFEGIASGSSFVALYPYGMSPSMSGTTLSFTLPSTQQYVSGSFGNGAFPMVAMSDGLCFEFKNLCSVLKLSIKGDHTVRSISFTPNDSKLKVAGPAIVSTDFSTSPQLSFSSEAVGTVTLECGDIALSKDVATDFYIVIPAQKYEGGFTVKVNTTTWIDPVFEQVTGKDFTAQRSMLYTMKEFTLGDRQGSGDPERDALIALYNATDGDNWTRNDNWCSSQPLSKWYGVYTNTTGHVNVISLASNNLKGNIPENIGNLSDLEKISMFNNSIWGTIPNGFSKLSKLKAIDMDSNSLSGEFPSVLTDLNNLEFLDLSQNELSGILPESIGYLVNLKKLYLNNYKHVGFSGTIPMSFSNLTNITELDLSNNNFSGSFPACILSMTKLEDLNLESNEFSGTFPSFLPSMTSLQTVRLYSNSFECPIPESYRDWALFRGSWGLFIYKNNITEEQFYAYGLKAPDFHVVDLDGNKIDSSIFASYSYTILYDSQDWNSDYWLQPLKDLYDKYHAKGLNIIQWNTESEEKAKKWAAQCDWTFLYSSYWGNNNISGLSYPGTNKYAGQFSPELTIVDSTGKIVFSTFFYYNQSYFVSYIQNLFGD